MWHTIPFCPKRISRAVIDGEKIPITSKLRKRERNRKTCLMAYRGEKARISSQKNPRGTWVPLRSQCKMGRMPGQTREVLYFIGQLLIALKT